MQLHCYLDFMQNTKPGFTVPVSFPISHSKNSVLCGSIEKQVVDKMCIVEVLSNYSILGTGS